MIGSALVVGGGIVGLTCARALALRGCAVTLLERKGDIVDEAGIGIGIQNNAMNALDELGLAVRVVERGVPVDTISVCAPDGRLLAQRPTDRWCGSSRPGFTGISRASLHTILVESAREAGVTLMTNAEVSAVDQSPDGAEAVLADGRRLSADLLVACDGIYSGVRGKLFPDFARPKPTGEAVWRALIPRVQRQDVSFVFGGGVGTVGYCPLQGELYLYVVDRADRPPPRDASDMAERMAALIAGIKGFPEELRPLISREPGDVTYRPLETVQLPPPWYRRRILLIGDAAHAGPPTLAQGAAMGIEDAVVLAQCLSDHDDLEAALSAFMDRRWPRVSTIVNVSLAISQAQMRPDGQPAVAEANRAAAAILSQPY